MPVQIDEAVRIKRRIAKAQRRVERNYISASGKETEEHRIERLTKRLGEINAASKS